jgi:glycosyltransferase involved in cell wall biosynthesis
MSQPSVLILDQLPKSIFSRLYTFLKVFIKEGILLKQWHYIFRSPSLGGSIEIPRNLIKTLIQKDDFKFDHNIFSEKKMYDIVCVIKDPDALRWAIEKKKKGHIKKIVTGPFISTLPTDNHGLLDDPHIDELIFLCDWHRKIFFEHYKFKNKKSFIWYAGVDTNRWQPDLAEIKDTVLIYLKWPNPELADHIQNFMIKNNIKYETIKCGFYQPDEYKEKLKKAKCVIFIAHSETQGLAIFEAWSMNVATFHWDPGFMNYYGKIFDGSSSAPYLTDELGDKFKNAEEFDENFLKFLNTTQKLNTRSIVSEKYTLAKSAQLFVDEILKHE